MSILVIIIICVYIFYKKNKKYWYNVKKNLIYEIYIDILLGELIYWGIYLKSK